MASSATPYGLRPINVLGGSPNSGALRKYKIASTYDTAIFQGDLVELVAAGTIEKETGTTTANPVGVFLGCEYTDSDMGFIHKNNWVANTVATDAMAIICDDPDMLFECQSDATLSQNAIGSNFALVQGAGDATTGVSGVTLNASTLAGTATLPIRVVDYVDKQGFSALGDDYTDMIVRINTHFNRNATGFAGS
jgi:hypothetical protein